MNYLFAMTSPKFEYRTTFAEVPSNFPDHEKLAEQLSRINPKPPKGENWQLVTAAPSGSIVFYFWERSLEPRE